MSRRRGSIKKTDPYTRDGADPLELMARLLGRTSYRVPVEGRGSAAVMMSHDVAGAVGMMRGQLEKQTALAVTQRAGAKQIARLSRTAYRAVIRLVRDQRPQPLDLHEPADRWRLRMAIYDAAHEMVYPDRRQSFGELAKAAKMRKASYITVHRCAISVLQQALNDGRAEFKRRLQR
jgi:hypothetical protein